MNNRERFEAWWVTWNDGNQPRTPWSDLRTHDGYNDEDIDMQWVAFNSASEELEVQVKQLTIDANCYKKGMEASNERLVQLAAENARLKSGIKYFSHSNFSGFEEHATAKEAMEFADADLAGEQDAAAVDGWSDETDTICWGVILQQAQKTNVRVPEDESPWDEICDYELLPVIETPATDAFLAEVRAQESKRVYESILDNPSVTDMGSLVDWLEQNANDSVAIAAQLRKGVQS